MSMIQLSEHTAVNVAGFLHVRHSVTPEGGVWHIQYQGLDGSDAIRQSEDAVAYDNFTKINTERWDSCRAQFSGLVPAPGPSGGGGGGRGGPTLVRG